MPQASVFRQKMEIKEERYGRKRNKNHICRGETGGIKFLSGRAGRKTVEELLKSHLDKSYEKNVPAQVRKFVESRMETPQETANQEEESQRTGGTRQQRASGRRSRETQNQEEQPREPVPETVEETAENTMSMGM